jgi:hypothetical protein
VLGGERVERAAHAGGHRGRVDVRRRLPRAPGAAGHVVARAAQRVEQRREEAVVVGPRAPAPRAERAQRAGHLGELVGARGVGGVGHARAPRQASSSRRAVAARRPVRRS